MTVHLLSLDLLTLRLPLVSPFRTSFGVQTDRTPMLVRVEAAVGARTVIGWGECVALPRPVYSSEFLDGARQIIASEIAPALRSAQTSGIEVTAENVGDLLAPIRGHRMAKAAVEMAVLDAQLRASDRSFASWLGVTATRVASGVSVGIQDSVPMLLDVVGGYLAEGYRRVKLKIEPGWDVEPVRAVRERFGDIPLQVDANTAYRLGDAAHLRRLDAFDLLLIEQPLADEDLRQHSLLARQLQTPVCLDESIVSAETAADAIALGASAIINVKPGRVGGYVEARRVHDVARAHGVPVWCGGMLETGIGRAANAALGGLPGFTLPGDISASDRFYREDITAPFVLDDEGFIAIPRGPGFGVEPDEDRVAAAQIHAQRVDLSHG
ncbi:o-succinylbenzoate synthase [Microbacterium sp. Leaf436]|uniref:o-succinylbenzoate synthase n=1 Tax=Microbacterium sp. Leaf436 TaxID=1736377 RepID=UPI000B33657E